MRMTIWSTPKGGEGLVLTMLRNAKPRDLLCVLGIGSIIGDSLWGLRLRKLPISPLQYPWEVIHGHGKTLFSHPGMLLVWNSRLPRLLLFEPMGSDEMGEAELVMCGRMQGHFIFA